MAIPASDPRRERRLLRVARRGDSRAFETLLQDHLSIALDLATRICGDRHRAEDVVQEAALRAYENLNTIRGEGAFRSWWLRIVVHRARTERGRVRDTRPLSDEEIALHEGNDGRAFEELSVQELEHAFVVALDQLPEGQRVALHLRVRERFDYREIAAILDTSEHAVRERVSAARKRMQRLLAAFLVSPEDER